MIGWRIRLRKWSTKPTKTFAVSIPSLSISFLAGDDTSNQVAVYHNSNVEVAVRVVCYYYYENKKWWWSRRTKTRLVGRPHFDDETIIISSKSFSIFLFSSYFPRLVYVVLGPYHEHIGLLTAMEDRHLFDRGNGSIWWLRSNLSILQELKREDF